MLKNVSKTKIQLVVAIICVAAGVVAYGFYVAKGLESPQVNCENLRASAALALKNQHYARAEQLLLTAADQASKLNNLPILAATKSELSDVLARQNKYAAAEVPLREAIECWRKNSLDKLQTDVSKTEVDAQIRLATLLEKQNKTAEALSTYQSVLSNLENDENGLRSTVFLKYCDMLSAAGMKKELVEARTKEELSNGGASTVGDHFYAGVGATTRNDCKTAIDNFITAYTLAKKWDMLNFQIDAKNWLTAVQISQSKFSEAQLSIDEAIMINKLIDKDYRKQHYQSLWLLGLLAELKGDRKAVDDVANQLHGATFESLQPMLVTASIWKQQNQLGKEIKVNQFALKTWEKAHLPVVSDLATVNFGIAVDYSTQGKFDDSNLYFDKAIRVWTTTLGPRALQIADSLSRIANNYTMVKQFEKSNDYLNRSLSLWNKIQGPESIQAAVVVTQIGQNFALERKYAESNKYFFRALAIGEKLVPTSKEFGALLQQIGQNYFLLAQYDDCHKYYERALKVMEAAAGSQSKQVGILLIRLADLYDKQNELSKRDDTLARAERIFEQASDPSTLQLVASRTRHYAHLYSVSHKFEESSKLFHLSQDALVKAKAPQAEIDGIERQILANDAQLKTSQK